ncbi:MAG: hypothetical protein K9J13_12770 [Saprospiraceae bacterium]|nr:hypothetical protein [Saprospiraceae bacterium]
MTRRQDISKLIQSHKAIENFDYDLAVDWAINLIEQGKETENILMLASFSKPIDRFEIKPYVSAVLNDFKLEELEGNEAIIAITHYHLTEILSNNSIRKNLQSLFQLYIDNDHKPELMNFYLLYYAWNELEEYGVNYYYEGANLDNIEEVLKNEAKNWMEKYINGKIEIKTKKILIENLSELAEKNLILIYNAPTESLKSSEFQNIDGTKLANSEELIFHLKEMELIESEMDNDVYYLTPETYVAVEGDFIDNIVNHYIYSQNNDDKGINEFSHKGEIEEEFRSKEIIEIQRQLTLEKQGKKSNRLVTIISVLVIIVVFSILFNKNRNEPSKPELDKELLKNIEREIQLKLDSTNKNVIIISQDSIVSKYKKETN